jgi:hypothetical protein
MPSGIYRWCSDASDPSIIGYIVPDDSDEAVAFISQWQLKNGVRKGMLCEASQVKYTVLIDKQGMKTVINVAMG